MRPPHFIKVACSFGPSEGRGNTHPALQNRIRQLFVLILLCFCFFTTTVEADTYPATREYYAVVTGDGTGWTHIGPLDTFAEAAQIAWDHYEIWPPEYADLFEKVDWYTDRFYPYCQTKDEPLFVNRNIYIDVYSTIRTIQNGNISCGGTQYSVLIQNICPYGGYLGYGLQEGDKCINAPHCAVRDSNTGKCLEAGRPSCNQQPDVLQYNPINIAVGNKFQQENDYAGSGVFPLTVSRYYNSVNGFWKFFPKIKIITAGSEVDVIRPDGKGLSYQKANGNWVSDPGVVGTLTATEDGSGNITGWTYTTGTDQVETYNAQGWPLSITARNGLSHTYAYTSDSITVTHTNGSVLTYHLDGNGRVIGFTDPAGNGYQYGYNTSGRLTQITFPDNTTRQYHYENSAFPKALTGITDENGDRYATWSYDDQGRAVSSEHAGGADKITIDYAHVEDTTDPRVTLTNPLGKQTTYHLTTLYDLRRVTTVEGHPTPSCMGANRSYTYDANGFVASRTDWNGNITTYTRDSNGRELSRTEAAGTPEERTVTTEWHPDFRLPIRITEPGKITEFTYDTNGNLLTRRERSDNNQ